MSAHSRADEHVTGYILREFPHEQYDRFGDEVDPDGSHTIDYRTGEECAVTWTLPDSLSEGLVERVIVPSVDKE